MHTNSLESRRNFIRNLAIGTSLAFLPASSIMASSSLIAPFNFRKGAALLPLHYNENSLGMSNNALSAAKEAITLYGNRYADGAVDELKQLIASYNQIPPEQLILGNGSTEVLGAVVTYAASMNATLLEPSPTFGDVRSRAKARNMKVVQVELGDNFETNIEQLKQRADKLKGPILVNLCNPNNPTGTIVDKKLLSNWITNAPSNHIFLVDEAYHEYATSNPNYSSALPLIKNGKENLIVTRTFSKIFGMAGMRVGYGIAAPKTAKKLDSLSASFNLSAAGIAAAKASLLDKEFFNKSLNANERAKALLTNTLDELSLRYIPSNTNFVLHRINSDLNSYTQRMLANNIKVGRRMTKDDGWNRISIGTPSQMEAFTKTLKSFREKGWV